MFVSVIMPTYNNLEILQYSLPAILKQNLDKEHDFEVVLVDDGCNKKNKKFIASVNDQRLKVVALEKNSGRSIARNRGIKRAQGEVLVFLDSDVTARVDLIQEHLNTLGISGKNSRIQPLVSSGRLINVYRLQDIGNSKYKLRDFSAAHFATGNSAVHRSFLERVQEDPKGPFDEKNFSVYGWEDLELGIRLASLSLKYRRSEAFGYHYCPPFDLEKIPVYMRKEAERAHTANRFYRKHPTLNVRLMTQKTFFHRLLWELLTLGGLFNEKTLTPLLKWLIKKNRHDLAEALARHTFLNLNYVRHL